MPSPQYAGLYVDASRRTWLEDAEVFDDIDHAKEVLAARRRGKRPAKPPTLVKWERGRMTADVNTGPWIIPIVSSTPYIELVSWGNTWDDIAQKRCWRHRLEYLTAADAFPVITPHQPESRHAR